MNGIRYASGCLGIGVPHKLLRDISRSWCHKNQLINNVELSSGGTQCFHGSANALRKSAESSVNSESLKGTNLKYKVSNGPDLADFIIANNKSKNKRTKTENIPYVRDIYKGGHTVYFEVYGCQMNVNDVDVVWSILKKNGYKKSDDIETADIVLLVTCAIRDGAEEKVWNKLDYLKSIKTKRTNKCNRSPMKIGVLGCMAERLKEKILQRNSAVDVIAGPDSYKDLPRLLAITENNETAINTILSFDETYADVTPVRLNPDSVTAFVTIMRGCDNMCTYCIVPFTRGRERSRPISSILDEVKHLSDQGVKEVTLLGQNVNSYRDLSQSEFYTGSNEPTNLVEGFKTVYKSKLGGVRFSELLDKVSLVDPEMRIRFTSPHPKDFPDEVLQLISERRNICRQLHLPVQSGNSDVLKRMRRGYTREAYLNLVDHVRNIIPNVSLSSDFIAGFCGETTKEFEDTISLMEHVQYNRAFLFAYSMREKTTAHRRYEDNVADSVKKARLHKLIELWKVQAERLNRQQVGSHQLVLIEGKGRKGGDTLVGRNDGNIRVAIPNDAIPVNSEADQTRPMSPGDYVVVQIYDSNSNTLSGIPLYHSTLSSYSPQVEDHRQRVVETGSVEPLQIHIS